MRQLGPAAQPSGRPNAMTLPSLLRQRSGTAWYRRLRYRLSRLFGTRLQKSQRVYLVDLNGTRFKRIILRDSFLAARIERNLERFGPSDRLPGLVMRYEHEIWVDFIPGGPVSEQGAELVQGLADLYGHIYARRPRRVPIDETLFAERLQRHLRFLGRVGVLSREYWRQLEAALPRLIPDAVWVGFDYTDPVPGNLVVASDDGRLCAIDVESLQDDVLIGTGVAKALARWMEPHRGGFLDALAGIEAPDFRAYLPFVELCCLASYTRMMVLEKKRRNIRPELFERFLAAGGSTTSGSPRPVPAN
jgi:hypothetical protein